MIFLFTVNIPSALSLYWLTGGIVAYIQQSLVLRKDEDEMEGKPDKPGKDLASIPEAEVIEKTKKKPTPAKKTKKTNRRKQKK
jgi:membrane protein insertase Oxa1/YidC/SpoIIIJ